MRRFTAMAAVATLAWLAPVRASAQDAPKLPHRMWVQADQLAVQVDLTASFGAPFREAFESGLHHTARIELRLMQVGGAEGGAPVSTYVRDCTVAYDLWGERYGVVLADGSDGDRRSVDTLEEVVALCGRTAPLAMLPLADLDLRLSYALDAVLVLDPAAPGPSGESAWTGDPLDHRRGGEPRSGSLFGAIAAVFDRGTDPEDASRVRLTGPVFGQRRIRALLEAASPGTAEREEE